MFSTILAKDWKGCASMVGRGAADLLNLDSGEIYHAGFDYNLQPLAAEYHGSKMLEEGEGKVFRLFRLKTGTYEA